MKKGTVQLKLESRKCDEWSYVIDSSVVISIVYLIASLQKSIGLVASSLYSLLVLASLEVTTVSLANQRLTNVFSTVRCFITYVT